MGRDQDVETVDADVHEGRRAGEGLPRDGAHQPLLVATATAVGRRQRADLDVLWPHEEQHLLPHGEPRGRGNVHGDAGDLRDPDR